MDNNPPIEKLKSELLRLRKRMDTSNDQLPIELGLPKILLNIESELNIRPLNKKKLEQDVYGIFRLVTESYELEKSSLGQDLLTLRMKIKELVSTLDTSE